MNPKVHESKSLQKWSAWTVPRRQQANASMRTKTAALPFFRVGIQNFQM